MTVSLVNQAVAFQAGKVSESISLVDCIVPRAHDAPSSFYNASVSQKEYMVRCADICNQLSDDFLKNPPPFLSLLKWLGEKRAHVAQGSEQSMDFGVLRDFTIYGTVRTPLIAHYAPLLNTIYQIGKDDPSMEWEFFDMNPEAFNIGTRIGYDSNGSKIRLTKYTFTRSLAKNEHFPDTMVHAKQEDLKNSLAVCEKLYHEILDSHDVKETQTKIAALHWWLSNACPYKRGSASCAEILIAALMHHKQLPLTPYVKGLFVDRIALVTSIEEFVQLYPSFRE